MSEGSFPPSEPSAGRLPASGGPRLRTRRAALSLLAGGTVGAVGLALLAACRTGERSPEAEAPTAAPTSAGRAPDPAPSAAPRSESTPLAEQVAPAVASPAAEPFPRPYTRRPILPAAPRQDRRLLLAGTPWEAPLAINRSDRVGPTVVVLSGVHGNEPGAWAAGDSITDWMPERGTLVVLPRANQLAIRDFVRTLPELGDLNRLYPGEPPESRGVLPMQRMARAIIDLVREFRPSLLLDLHESWMFYAERTQNGTSSLGQTITSGGEPAQSSRIDALLADLNPRVSDREQFIARDRRRWGRIADTAPRDSSWPTGGTSSLGIGRFVPGVLPVLVEMGQQGQAEARRAELHRLVVGTALRHEGLGEVGAVPA